MRPILLFFLFTSLLFATQFKIETITQDLSVPWGMTFVDESQLLITQRNGTALIVNTKTKAKQPLKGLPKDILVKGQGGLMDVALHLNGWLYFTYVKNVNSMGATTLARAKLKGTALTSWQDLLVTNSRTETARHYGSRIAFEGEYVYFGVGDRGVRANAQELSNDAGAILRLHVDGKLPKDNFKGAIFSYGHRNPQGLFFDTTTNRLWEIEHGPRGGDEINLIEKGKNYGWPIISYGQEYWGPVAVGESTHKEGMQQPVYHYTPSIAPSSLLVYQGDAFAQWKGNLFAGALAKRHLNRIIIDKAGKFVKEERLLEDLNLRIRHVIEDEKGHLYLSTDNGLILKLSPP